MARAHYKCRLCLKVIEIDEADRKLLECCGDRWFDRVYPDVAPATSGAVVWVKPPPPFLARIMPSKFTHVDTRTPAQVEAAFDTAITVADRLYLKLERIAYPNEEP